MHPLETWHRFLAPLDRAHGPHHITQAMLQKLSAKLGIAKFSKPTKALIGFFTAVVLLIASIILFAMLQDLADGLGQHTATDEVQVPSLQRIENQVAADAVEQYNIAKRQGDRMSICVQAGLVSAAYLQAKDEVNYIIWKDTERKDCKRAGVPR